MLFHFQCHLVIGYYDQQTVLSQVVNKYINQSKQVCSDYSAAAATNESSSVITTISGKDRSLYLSST